MPAPDDLDRDKFYTSAADDDGEYELEELDPALKEADERRKAEALAAVNRSIDINEVYRDHEKDHSSAILHGWVKDLRSFRFQVKHLLIATAVVAIAMTLHWHDMLGPAIVLLLMFGTIGLYLYLQWKEKQYQDEVAARRHEMYARRRAAQLNPAAIEDTRPAPQTSAPVSAADDVDTAWQKARKRQEFRFQFSLAQLMGTMIGSAIVLGFVSILGPQHAATVLGLVALIGLVAHAIGVQPPTMIILGWWLLLVFYVVLSIFTVFWNATK